MPGWPPPRRRWRPRGLGRRRGGCASRGERRRRPRPGLARLGRVGQARRGDPGRWWPRPRRAATGPGVGVGPARAGRAASATSGDGPSAPRRGARRPALGAASACSQRCPGARRAWPCSAATARRAVATPSAVGRRRRGPAPGPSGRHRAGQRGPRRVVPGDGQLPVGGGLRATASARRRPRRGSGRSARPGGPARRRPGPRPRPGCGGLEPRVLGGGSVAAVPPGGDRRAVLELAPPVDERRRRPPPSAASAAARDASARSTSRSSAGLVEPALVGRGEEGAGQLRCRPAPGSGAVSSVPRRRASSASSPSAPPVLGDGHPAERGPGRPASR